MNIAMVILYVSLSNIILFNFIFYYLLFRGSLEEVELFLFKGFLVLKVAKLKSGERPALRDDVTGHEGVPWLSGDGVCGGLGRRRVSQHGHAQPHLDLHGLSSGSTLASHEKLWKTFYF